VVSIQPRIRLMRSFDERHHGYQGYVLDKKRMENGTFLGEDYFERLLEAIREIRLRYANRTPEIHHVPSDELTALDASEGVKYNLGEELENDINAIPFYAEISSALYPPRARSRR